MVQVRAYRQADEERVLELWAECELVVAWNDPRKDVARKLAQAPEELLVAVDGGVVIGTAMAGYDGHRGWICYFAVDPARRGAGVGRQLVGACEALLAERGCPKVNLMVRGANVAALEFYERLGYEPSDVVTLGRRLVADE